MKHTHLPQTMCYFHCVRINSSEMVFYPDHYWMILDHIFWNFIFAIPKKYYIGNVWMVLKTPLICMPQIWYTRFSRNVVIESHSWCSGYHSSLQANPITTFLTSVFFDREVCLMISSHIWCAAAVPSSKNGEKSRFVGSMVQLSMLIISLTLVGHCPVWCSIKAGFATLKTLSCNKQRLSL